MLESRTLFPVTPKTREKIRKYDPKLDRYLLSIKFSTEELIVFLETLKKEIPTRERRTLTSPSARDEDFNPQKTTVKKVKRKLFTPS
ncbi:hypothetical protein [Parendozoicomonas sp. Alg238-R29]|uniref:hypothetical protein n=1 Tax=Parendozoicomonas sp. Alg238-R29 TaxID=2993446 RepID=UPI00248DAA32|nr:hypothetical protein [Parendozoicomonas sp. Alg238-R29]